MKIADIISKVETYHEGGESIPKISRKGSESLVEALKNFKTSMSSHERELQASKTPETKDPNREALTKLQDHGLSQRMQELPQATIVGGTREASDAPSGPSDVRFGR